MNYLKLTKITDEAESLKDVNKNLQSILESMSLDSELTSKARVLIRQNISNNNQLKLLKLNKQREELLN
jgi:hypothetical protein